MADIVALGTNQNGWTKGSNGSIGTLSGKGAWSQVVNLPTATAGRNVISGLAVSNSMEVAWACEVAGAEVDARLWRLNTAGVVLSPQPCLTLFLAQVSLKFGTAGFTGGIFGSTTQYFAHTIEVADDATLTPPGVRFSGMIDPAENAMAAMLFDSIGLGALVIETKNITAGANACPIWRPV